VTIRLFPFQDQAAAQLSEAADEWVHEYAAGGVRKLGLTPIPFIGHLKAVTGAGKTPILAKVVGELSNALVLWTSVSAAVVDQTYRNLRGRYRPLLPPGTQILRERPSKSEWESLIQADSGVTIWVTTVGSWNEAEAAESGGMETARLNMHRPQPDWGGEKSPWEQLRTVLKRPVWVVYDESHNQTPAQLDQLVGLKPVGFLLASATPPSSDRFEQFIKATASDAAMKRIAEKARLRIDTRDVVAAQLLKEAIEVENFDADPDALLEATVVRHKDLRRRAKKEGAAVNPKVVYIVEASNPRKGELISRPVSIWEYLRTKKIPADEIAIYTQTKVVPDEAERVSSLSDLKAHHRHIICNRALQEGWDDPEAYVEYFDDESNSYTRIAQIIGRALRQPGAHHFSDEALNTAYLFVRVPNKTFEEIIAGLKRELALYATDEDDPYGSSPIRIKTKREALPDIPVKRGLAKKLVLPNYQLGEADLGDEVKKIVSQATKPWDEAELIAPGTRVMKRISLAGEDDDTRYQSIAAAARRPNGEFLRRRIQAGNRHCAHLLEPKTFTGPAYEQRASSGSLAQKVLAERAAAVIDQFERSVQLVLNEIKAEETWRVPPHQPSSEAMVAFRNAAHSRYGATSFNGDERSFAEVLDSLNIGVWARNSSRGSGYGIELPVKVGTSNTFYPDFLWWIDGTCYAIDPTGAYILNEKVRGKLLAIPKPKIVLVTRGRVSKEFSSLDAGDEGWTIVRHLPGRSPTPEYFSSLREALLRIAKGTDLKMESKSEGARRTISRDRPSSRRMGSARRQPSGRAGS
jgi:type III restriction enzyme